MKRLTAQSDGQSVSLSYNQASIYDISVWQQWHYNTERKCRIRYSRHRDL